MPNSLKTLLSTLDSFIKGDSRSEEEFFARLSEANRFDEESYYEGIQHLSQCLHTTNSSDLAYSRIHVGLAIFKLLSPSPTQNDVEDVIQHFNAAFQQNSPLAMCVMGTSYENGFFVAKDPGRAVEFYRKASDAGLAAGTHNLGFCYQHGRGVAKDPVKAVELYRKASDAGFARASYKLASCYENGIGVAKDPVKAVELYRKASNAGFAAATFNLILKKLKLYLSESNSLTVREHIAIAKCCISARRRFPLSDEYKMATEILSALQQTINTFEVRYWTTLTLHPKMPNGLELCFNAGPLLNLMTTNLHGFLDCLLQDDVHTLQEKQPYYRLLLDKFAEKLSPRHRMLIHNELGELKVLLSHKISFFALLPKELLENFAKGTLGSREDKTAEEFATEIKFPKISQPSIR